MQGELKMKNQNNNFKLSDLMTADQALKILEYCESLEKRVENLENEVKALRYELTWKDVYDNVRMYTEKELI